MKNVAKSSDHQHQNPNSGVYNHPKQRRTWTIIKTQSTSNTNQNSSQEKSWRSVFPSRSLLRWPVEISPLVATRSRLRQLGPVFSALQMASPTLEAAGPWRRVKAGPRPCWDWVFTQARSAFFFLAQAQVTWDDLDGAGVPPEGGLGDRRCFLPNAARKKVVKFVG